MGEYFTIFVFHHMHRAEPLRGVSGAETEELFAQIRSCQYTYTRGSFSYIPAKKADFKRTGIPFIVSATILPVDEEEVKETESVPRCKECKAYLSPYCEVVPPGYKWRCSICRVINDVSSPLHSYGASLRVFSPSENAENNRKVCTNPILTEDVIEFVSGKDRETPPASVYLFAVECTLESVERGVVETVLKEIPAALQTLDDPYDRSEICILLFGSSVRAIRLSEKDGLGLDTINEVEGVLPMIIESEYVVPVQKARKNLEKILQEIKDFAVNGEKEVKNDFGLALKVAGHLLYKGGHIFSFLSSKPSLGAGAIPVASVLGGKIPFYERMKDEMIGKNIALSLIVLSSKTVEIPALLSLVEGTGGDIRYYPAFLSTHAPDKEYISRDLRRYLSQTGGSNVFCRIRASEGVVIKKYWGVHVQDDGLIRMPLLMPGRTFSFEVEYNGDLVTEGITFQIAAIFNNAAGKRLVKLINLSVGVGPIVVDPLGVVHAIAIKSLDKECAEKGSGVRTVMQMAADALGYTGMTGTMAVFPNLVFGLLKNKVFKNVSSDLRGLIMHGIRNYSSKIVDAIIYPTLVRIDEEIEEDNEDAIILPSPLRLSSSVISTDGTYFLDSGIVAYVFTGDASNCRLFDSVEGRIAIPYEEAYKKIRNVVKYMVLGRLIDPVVYSVHQTGHSFLLEGFQSMLLEDGASSGCSSLQDLTHRLLSKGYATK